MASNSNTNSYNKRLDYIRDYSKENYERINLTVKKGLKDVYKEAAQKLGFNLSSFFVAAADEYIERHKEDTRIK